MLNFVKVFSTDYEELQRRVVKFLRLGAKDVQTSNEGGPFGIDSNPIKDYIAIYSPTGEKGETVIIGYLNVNQLAGVGETRLFSTDESGNLKFEVWLHNDGTASIGGTDDNLVRFSELKKTIDELQDDIKALKQVFATTWIVTPNDGGAALKAASATWAGTPLQNPIDPAKIEEIKTLKYTPPADL